MKNSVLTIGVLLMAFLSFGQVEVESEKNQQIESDRNQQIESDQNQQIENNQKQMADSWALDEFDKIKVEDGINVVLEFGNTESIRIEGDGVTNRDVDTNVFFDKLTIERKGNKNADLTAYVTYKNLKKVIAKDGSSVESTGLINMDGDFEIEAEDASSIVLDISAGEIEVDVKGNSTVELNANASEVDADISSSSTLTLIGSGQELEVKADGSGQFVGYEFNSRDADLDASDGAIIQANVSEKLDAEADSGGSITYKGDPTNTKSQPKNGGTVQPAR